MEVQEGAGERRMELSAAAALCASGGTAQGKQRRQGSMVKRLRHRPFTAVTRVRFPLESSVKRPGSEELRSNSSGVNSVRIYSDYITAQ